MKGITKMKDYKLTEKEINGITHYYATFTDGEGVEQTTELAKDVFDAINESQTQISSRARKDRRYGLCSFDESIGDADIINDEKQTDELLKMVWEHMGELTAVQQRRIHLYFEENKTFEQIAEIEGVGWQRVQKSINLALNQLRTKKYFEKN